MRDLSDGAADPVADVHRPKTGAVIADRAGVVNRRIGKRHSPGDRGCRSVIDRQNQVAGASNRPAGRKRTRSEGLKSRVARQVNRGRDGDLLVVARGHKDARVGSPSNGERRSAAQGDRIGILGGIDVLKGDAIGRLRAAHGDRAAGAIGSCREKDIIHACGGGRQHAHRRTSSQTEWIIIP